MAKSLRSKWKRKMRANKRVRYGVKEDKRMENMLEEAKQAKTIPHEEMKQDLRKSWRLKNVGQKETEKAKDETTSPDDCSMDTAKAGSAHGVTSLRNENGSYPVWVSNRKIQNMKLGKKKPEGKVNKRKKKKFL